MSRSHESPLKPINRSDDSAVANDRSVHAVALDMDGLLFDTERIYWKVGDALLGRRGYQYCHALQARMMGRIGVAAAQEMIDFHGLADRAEDLLEESDQLYGELLPKLLRPMPGLDEWIDTLRRSEIPFALTTSSRRRFVDIILDTVSWRDLLRFELTGDDVLRGKPHPEMYQKAAAQFGTSASNLLVLEDSGNGCTAGVAAGAMVVAVPNEHTREQDFGGAVLVADHLCDPRLWALLK